MKQKLLKNFEGKYVVILLSSVSMSESNPETGMVTSGSVLIEGWVIDMDDTFLYLGDNEIEITDCVKLDGVARITIHNENIDLMHGVEDNKQWN